ncbi:MAG: hypothetical protein JOZ06_08695, partial [Paludibacterium sp.]|nr:hypothetical protein [Paludibacterium sp.]
MTMQYFKDANDAVHGFDDTDPAQVALMNSLAIDQEWVDVTSSWPPAPTLAQTQTGQIAVLSAACQSAITTGFTSKALGPSYNYGSQLTDQNNLLSALS